MKAVILIGGGGTRLWPLSTPEKPKQFQALASSKTMLEDTVARLDFLKPEDIFLALNKEHIGYVKELCPQIPDENIIIEPALRDTASAIGFAATIIQHRHPSSVMATISADHLIQNKQEFQDKLQLAAEIADQEKTLNVVEVPATEPNINYGYAEKGELLDSTNKIYALKSFKEKPDLHHAKEFVLSGNYFWNTGIYVWRTDVLLEHYQKLQPETYAKFQEITKYLGTDQEDQIIREHYPTLAKISIDYAIMEKVDPSKVRLIEAHLGWSDIGNWQAIWEVLEKDENGNIVRGNAKLLDSQNCLIHNNTNTPIGLIAVEDLVVINSDNGLLICKKDQSMRVKEI